MKKLSDILSDSYITENSDAELENFLESFDAEELTEGNVVLTMGYLNDIISESDNIYNTVSELEKIDEETQREIQSIHKTLHKLYSKLDQKYSINEVNLDCKNTLIEEKTLKQLLNQ